ncbi:uncharacterized protein LOC129918578 [Episyrphus balteatus]|uniref:uncharacterized protein LOC129918578 n=1 Tax=Episyrphus balteatus TaxID=286459 RepID=UPI002486B97B|nr:uncharacterized protein LOC129918578 [Episyrphus balteatus]
MNLINEQSVTTSTSTSKELSPSAQVRRGARSSSSLLSLSSSLESKSESEVVVSNVTTTTTTSVEYLAASTASSLSSTSSTSSFASSSSSSSSTFESAALTFSTLVRSSSAVESINRQIEKISNKISFSDAADQINLISSKMPGTTTTIINGIVKPPSSSSTSSAASKSLIAKAVLPPTTITTTTKNVNIENVSSCCDVSDCIKNKNGDYIKIDNTTITTTTTTTKPPEKERKIGCEHYKRRAMFVTPCCNKFYKCRYCHDEKETHHFDRKTLTELICVECNTRQKVQEQCEKCGVRFGKYTCLICNLFDDEDKNQYHCNGCGICRIGGRDNFFHCEVCNMCLPIELKIEGHRCVENISRSNCPVCLGAIHTSRIPCHIPDCGHLLHKMCFDQLLASGHYVCPTCQTSLLDMSKMWEYLDTQALLMTMPKKYENQRVYIFCNDCHDTCKTKFHFVGLKCIHCGGYNTTQDVKRRMSWANVDSSTSA